MMAFITHYCTRPLVRLLLGAVLLGAGGMTLAQTIQLPAPQLKIERVDTTLLLSTQLRFDLPAVVEDALLKGIPIYFLVQAEVLRERWYWSAKQITSVQRQLRLSYHPLTRRWRLNTASDAVVDATQGLALNQNFETLDSALASIRRIARWKIAELSDLEPDSKHLVAFRFQLDVTQLPRPLQIGTLGQSDWLVSLSATEPLAAEVSR